MTYAFDGTGYIDSPPDACFVRVAKPELDYLAVVITFEGSLAFLPSVNHKRTNEGRIVRSYDTKKKLKLMTEYYCLSLMQSGIMAPSFGDSLVSVNAFLAHKPRRWDSHNLGKELADWLESIGLINDDSQAEVDCRKKVEYTTVDNHSSNIFIFSRELVSKRHYDHILFLRSFFV